MRSINEVTILGNVGKQPVMRTTNNGDEIASFSIATSENWNDKITGEKNTITTWHNVVVLSKGLVCVVKSYVKQGSKIYIKGKLSNKEWVDKQGVKRYKTEIILQGFDAKLILLDDKKPQEEPYSPEITIDDDILF